MQSRWNEEDARTYASSPQQLRVYTSRLLGSDPDLVLHGGGNTSVKVVVDDFFGNPVDTLFVKGSGWDLATIEEAGFAPVRIDVLKQLAALETLSDSDMVEQQRIAMLNPKAPNASVEAILHAIIPFKYVDHTHADAVLALTNTEDGDERIRSLYGERVIVIPYVMPGFALARLVYERTRDIDWSAYDGMILMNHGVFTFSDSARDSYETMIQLVSEAEAYLESRDAQTNRAEPEPIDSVALAQTRARVSAKRGCPTIARFDRSPEAAGYAKLPNLSECGALGPLTPDHSIFAKRIPVILAGDPTEAIDAYASEYAAYFERAAQPGLTCLDPAPRWAIWPGQGIVSFGLNAKNAQVIRDIAAHTAKVVQLSESLGGWHPLSESEIFQVEYWELEQAKLKSGPARAPLQGKIALVALNEPELAQTCVANLLQLDAAVASIGAKPIDTPKSVAFRTLDGPPREAVEATVHAFGGIDILISDFPLDAENGLESDPLLANAIPFLQLGIQPKIVAVDSANTLQAKLETFVPETITVRSVRPNEGFVFRSQRYSPDLHETAAAVALCAR